MRKKCVVSSKAFAAILAVVLVIGCAIGGTVAWLVTQTDPVTNTFSYGDINIALAETTGSDYRILPGNNIVKDPKVTVKQGSEACWLFVKIEEEHWPVFTEEDGTTRKVDYAVTDGWTALEGVKGVYYRQVDAAVNDTSFEVLQNNQVTVSENLTKEEINTVTEQLPILRITAYAVQRDTNIATAADAWRIAGQNP